MNEGDPQRALLSLVVPVYNEADTVNLFTSEVTRTLAAAPALDIEIVFVNDGSTDATLDTLLELQKREPRIQVVDLSRNFGKEAAMTAGLFAARGDAVVPIDVDLQDPPEVILAMLDKWRSGYEVVVGQRIDRSSDSWAKRTSARMFYRIHNRMARPKIPENVGDFRLMDRCVVNALKRLPESNRFMKGLFAWVGFRTASVEYTRPERFAGSTKFTAWKLWNFAVEGFTSFSTAPLRIWTYVGLTVWASSSIYAIYIILRVLILGVDAPGYASLMVAVTFFGGLQLFGIGILGEYLGRTYLEAKNRPVYVVRNVYGSTAPDHGG